MPIDFVVCCMCICSDADDAIYERDGYNYDGYTLRVERPRGLGGGRGGGRGGGSFRSNYGGRGDSSRGRGGGGGGQATRRSDYRVSVTGKNISLTLAII